MNDVMVYGAYGYTGKLIVDELIKGGLKPTLAGRDKNKTSAMANSLGLRYLCFDLSDKKELTDALVHHKLVIHCAGPFIHTSEVVAEACIDTNTHYIDITGEYQVFEHLKQLSEKAARADIMLLPGAGFDVVPSDCLAAHLKSQLPNADQLTLAFTGLGGGLSRGTTKTMIENIDKGHVLRKNGELISQPSGKSTITVNYGDFEQESLGISWGDISSAHHSTGIPNIQVFMGSNKRQIKQARMTDKLSFLLKPKFIKTFLKNKVDKKSAGPSNERRQNSQMYLWGRVENEEGKIKEARLMTPNGYTLTALTAALITKKILQGDLKPGFQTPSTAYGKNLILEIDNVRLD